ncbi:hypothetical protein BKA66DRAFT_462365 [Pyrenochaeta sp. MPI-SDFR-AT-0127]|nr:hypothetical protein BKA66DRAFT_462365 [Pyrenochaeta sp. MPI-SDFR-AT-0127]
MCECRLILTGHLCVSTFIALGHMRTWGLHNSSTRKIDVISDTHVSICSNPFVVDFIGLVLLALHSRLRSLSANVTHQQNGTTKTN